MHMDMHLYFKKDADIKTSLKIKIVKDFSEFDAVDQAKETILDGVSKLGGLEIPSEIPSSIF